MTDIWRSVRYAFRAVWAEPRLTVGAVITLALGIAANAIVFSAIDALLFRPLPVAHPEQLAAVFTSDASGVRYGTSSFLDYQDFSKTGVFSTTLAFRSALPMIMRGDASVERRRVSVVTGTYFEALGIQPAAGRLLSSADDQPGVERRIVLSDAAWLQMFARSAQALGKTIVLNDQPFVVVGVAPPQFTGLRTDQRPDAWITVSAGVTNPSFFTNRRNRGLWIMGRLRPGVTLAQARAAFDLISARLHDQYPADWSDLSSRPRTITVLREPDTRYRNALGEESRVTVIGAARILLALVGVLLLVACANVANLQLARATIRRRELAVRLALGASRNAIAWQWLTESLVLSALGAFAAIALAWSLLAAIKSAAQGLPMVQSMEWTIDGRVLAYTTAVSLLVTFVFGTGPALMASRTAPMAAFRNDSAVQSLRRWLDGRGMLVAFQLAASLVLLTLGGTLVRTLVTAISESPGFATTNVALLSIQFPPQMSASAAADVQRQIVQDVKSLADVEDAAFARFALLSDDISLSTILVHPGTSPENETSAFVNQVGPGYFDTLRIPVTSGRPLTASDAAAGAPPVIVVSEALARRHWVSGHALGQRIKVGGATAPPAEVVGITSDVSVTSPTESREAIVFAPFRASGATSTLHVRARGSSAAVIPSIRDYIRETHRDVVVFDVKTIEQHTSTARAPLTLAASALTLFAVIGVGVAITGLSSVIAFAVSRRTREIAIRVSLGATQARVARLVASEASRLVTIGIILGSALAVPATIAVRTFGGWFVSSWQVLLASGTLLAAVSASAILLSLRRAVLIEPTIALRLE